MNCKIPTALTYKLGFILSFFLIFSQSSNAQTSVNHGVLSGTPNIIWFKPVDNVAWVDIHFIVGESQQNIRMVANPGTGRFDQPVEAIPGTVVNYSFTYSLNGFQGFDTNVFEATFEQSSELPSINCSSIPQWKSTTIYSEPGISVQTASRAFKNKWWTQGEDPLTTAEWGVWHFEGICEENTSSSISSSSESSSSSSAISSNNPTSVAASSSSLSSNVASSSLASTSSLSESSSSASVLPSSSSSSSSSSIDVTVNRSLFIHDVATIQAADFSLRSTLQQLVDQFNNINQANPTTVEELFSRMWDTQNPAPGVVEGGEKCTGTLNGFDNECRPAEGSQAQNPSFFIDSYIPIGLINRMDLRDKVTFNDCGEYRVIYANQGGGRNFIIFEAQLPNPRPGLNAGCLPIAKFWQSLSAEADPIKRAAALRQFYFQGIAAANVRPVIDIRNYANTTGQIRTNMFMGGSWDLKEFKAGVDSNGLSVIKPSTVKSNPVAFLFDGNQTDPRAIAFQQNFLDTLDGLLLDFNTFSLTVNDAHNNGQSHASGSIDENLFGPAFFNANSNAFQQAVESKLAASGSKLTSTQVMNRAMVMTCGGCHQPGSFGLTFGDSIGPNLVWPDTLGFTHISEFSTNGFFPLSPALTNVFLPVRLGEFNNYLATAGGGGSPVKNGSSSSSSSSSKSKKKFGKRAG